MAKIKKAGLDYFPVDTGYMQDRLMRRIMKREGDRAAVVILAAIAEAYKVTVLDVRTANRKGKATRFSRGKHAYPGITYRQDHKVAYITVKEGDKIPVFEDTKTEADKSEKSTKTTKTTKDQKAQKPAETAAAKAAKAEKKVARSAKKSAKENQ